jgi:CheY-specific phosphatase CheX
VLKEVISEVLETMFFAMVDFSRSGEGDRSFDYESEINLLNYNGRTSISLCVSEAFASLITANFLGVEENQLTDSDLKDSLKELANMVGGGFHARVNGVGWQLGIPRVWRLESEGTDEVQAADRLVFDYFGEPAGFALIHYLPN